MGLVESQGKILSNNMVGSEESAKMDVEGSGGKVRAKKRQLDAIRNVVRELLVWSGGVIGGRLNEGLG